MASEDFKEPVEGDSVDGAAKWLLELGMEDRSVSFSFKSYSSTESFRILFIHEEFSWGQAIATCVVH